MKDTIKLTLIGFAMWGLFGATTAISMLIVLCFVLFLFGGKDDK